MAIELFGFQIGKKDTGKNKSFALPEVDDGATVVAGGGVFGQYVDLEGTARSEVELINRYREMTLQHEVDAAVDDIVNESIITSQGDEPVSINLDKLEVPDNIKTRIGKEFKEITRLLDFGAQAYDIFKRWYIDGRLYYHIIIDEKNTKTGIQELRALDPRKIKKIREVKKSAPGLMQPQSKEDSLIKKYEEYFIYNDKGIDGSSYGGVGPSASGIKIAPDSVCYTHSGLMDAQRKRVLSYLHKAIKPLNQLKMIEDSLVIYRLARAPERRIFYIDVGNLPKLKAEQYLRDIMVRYKNKMVYDASTGEIRDDRKHMSMLEDYWLPRREGGRGTEITTLPGGQNLGEIEDILYFQKKLYKSLNVPISRLEPETGFNLGRASEITRDELKFARFVDRLRHRFVLFFNRLLETQLALKGIMNKQDWNMIRQFVNYDFLEDSHFEELKRSEIMQDRMNVLRDMSEYAGKYYSHNWIRKNVLHQAEDEMVEIDNEITSEKNDSRYASDEDEGGGGGLYSQKEHSKKLDLISEQNIDEKIDLRIDEMKDEIHLKDNIQNVFDTILNEKTDA
tara:strand:- start:1697 stop:3391 length:1695 start_codon:yes stop_codon:yes gene_type:complete